jgi:hypothetical protein
MAPAASQPCRRHPFLRRNVGFRNWSPSAIFFPAVPSLGLNGFIFGALIFLQASAE